MRNYVKGVQMGRVGILSNRGGGLQRPSLDIGGGCWRGNSCQGKR